MSGLTIIEPLAITPAMLVSTDVTEADHATYAGGTTYAAADRVIYNHNIYQSLQASNTGHQPDLAASAAWWVLVSAVNRWKLFDLVNSSATTKASSMTYTVRPGSVVNSVAAIGLTGVQTIRIRMVSDAYGTVYDKTITRYALPSESAWWAWFFGKRSDTLYSYYADLPSYIDAQIIIDFTGLSTLAVGSLLIGNASTWGMGVNHGATLGIRDYSKKETNEWGDIVLTRRVFSKKAQYQLVLEKDDVDAFYDYLASIRATPCLWVASEDYSSTVIFGFYQDFEVLISYPTISECNLTIEGLT